MIFRKEPFFYGHDNYDQLVKIAKVLFLPPALALIKTSNGLERCLIFPCTYHMLG